jgi:hypothetical protein
LIDEPLELVGPAEGWIALEDDSVEAGKNPVDESGKTDWNEYNFFTTSGS